MNRRETILALLALGSPLAIEAQQGRVYRVGVITLGGTYHAAIVGLREGLRELGLEEGKQFVLHVRDTKGDRTLVEAAARNLEEEKVDLIYATSTSIAIAAQRATKKVPIVFYAGSDPVATGLVESYRTPPEGPFFRYPGPTSNSVACRTYGHQRPAHTAGIRATVAFPWQIPLFVRSSRDFSA